MNFAIKPSFASSNLGFASKTNRQTKINKQTEQTNKQTEQTDENPINRLGVASNLTKATFAAGLAAGGKLLCTLIEDGDFVTDKIIDTAWNVADKRTGLKGGKKAAYIVAASASIAAAIICGIAVVYTLIKSPKIAYDSKVNKYTKSKEMDTYIKSNEIEKQLYSQIANSAKDADDNEKKELQNSYETLALAKNKIPDFLKK